MLKLRSLAAALAALLAGCASNPYAISYRPSVSAKVPRGEPVALEPAAEAPRLLTTQDLRADAIRLLESGYRPIGRSSFSGSYVDARLALRQAADVGADVVVVRQKHVRTDTVSVPVMEWEPDRRIVQHETSQTFRSDSKAVDTTTHESVTTIEGEYQTRWVPQTVETWDQVASYWRKAPPPILGVLGSDLDEEERKALDSNKGLLVKVVLKDSPAFKADLMRGDILRRIGAHEILGAADFFAALPGLAGKRVDIELWRDGRRLVRTAELARP